MRDKESMLMEQSTVILPEYGTQKLMYCADAYRSIAKIFLNFPGTEEKKDLKSRQGAIYHRQILENQNFMAEQFLDMADKLAQVATQS